MRTWDAGVPDTRAPHDSRSINADTENISKQADGEPQVRRETQRRSKLSMPTRAQLACIGTTSAPQKRINHTLKIHQRDTMNHRTWYSGQITDTNYSARRKHDKTGHVQGHAVGPWVGSHVRLDILLKHEQARHAERDENLNRDDCCDRR